jgi:hypothetical protein
MPQCVSCGEAQFAVFPFGLMFFTDPVAALSNLKRS